MTPWIQATGQFWKILVFGVLLVATAVFFVAMIFSYNGLVLHPALDRGQLVAAFCAATLVTFGWLFASVSCASCRGKPAWHVVRHAGLHEWFVVLVSSPVCPACGRSSARLS